MDAAAPPAIAAPAPDPYVFAPGDIYPRGARETSLCARADHPDWAYLAALAALDTGAIWLGSSSMVKYSGSVASLVGPALIGTAWGATVSGAWLALPKCSPTWVDGPPREGDVRPFWPLALSLALLAGATAPVINGIAIGSSDLPLTWTDANRALHLVVAGVFGFAGALLPYYVVPPRTWTAARELERVRFGADAHGGFVAYSVSF